MEGHIDPSWISERDDRTSIICGISIFDRKPYLMGQRSKHAEQIQLWNLRLWHWFLPQRCKSGNGIYKLEILIWAKVMLPISLYRDNEAILLHAYSHVYDDESRHIEIKYSYVRQNTHERSIYYYILTIVQIFFFKTR